jgi:hypothetical protein
MREIGGRGRNVTGDMLGGRRMRKMSWVRCGGRIIGVMEGIETLDAAVLCV